MLEITNAKMISGTVDLPPNPDFFLLTLVVALAAGKKVHIGLLSETPLIELYRELFENQLSITRDESGYTVTELQQGGSSYIVLPYRRLPYCDCITFALLAMQKTVAFRDLPAKRLEAWKQKAALFKCTLDTNTFDDATGISLSSDSDFTPPAHDTILDMDNLHVVLGMALGLKKPVSVTLDQHFQTPLRDLLGAFGYAITVKSNIEQKKADPLLRRFQLMTSRAKKSGDQKYSFTVTVELDKPGLESVDIVLPGDDILGSLLLLAKCLVQKGQLIINNIPLEPWCVAMLNYIRKMGCIPGIQENRQTSFGAAGMVTLQKFKVIGRTTECKPLFHYDRYLPMLVVLSSYATGQSVFRNLQDLRNEAPDLIEQYLSCVRLLGARHGEMPDGIVVDGARQYDGFDLTEGVSAALSGACAIAGIRCSGKTTIEDSRLLERWPDFVKILEKICENKI